MTIMMLAIGIWCSVMMVGYRDSAQFNNSIMMKRIIKSKCFLDQSSVSGRQFQHLPGNWPRCKSPCRKFPCLKFPCRPLSQIPLSPPVSNSPVTNCLKCWSLLPFPFIPILIWPGWYFQFPTASFCSTTSATCLSQVCPQISFSILDLLSSPP